MAITLKARDVALAAKAAYDEKRLSAQGGTPGCYYRDASGRPCAVGAALTDEQAKKIHNGATVYGLVEFGIEFDEVVAVYLLQEAHDSWAMRVNSEANFVRVLEAMLHV